MVEERWTSEEYPRGYKTVMIIKRAGEVRGSFELRSEKETADWLKAIKILNGDPT